MLQGEQQLLLEHTAIFLFVLLDQSFSIPVNLSVECHDNQAVTASEYAQALAAAEVQSVWIQDILPMMFTYSPCAIWNVGHAPASFQTPVHSEVPTLLLAGGYDPVTPVEWSQQALPYLSHAHLITFAGIGHGVLGSHVCATAVIEQFLTDPYQYPDVPCLLEVGDADFQIWPNDKNDPQQL